MLPEKLETNERKTEEDGQKPYLSCLQEEARKWGQQRDHDGAISVPRPHSAIPP